mmetsp:Transcript_18255/g.39233  ORF Transcript_18255/g.39233 Transcript_18255/m.39233 type:complete len:85 (+) Transcript_18255:167-421(+)
MSGNKEEDVAPLRPKAVADAAAARAQAQRSSNCVGCLPPGTKVLNALRPARDMAGGTLVAESKTKDEATVPPAEKLQGDRPISA